MSTIYTAHGSQCFAEYAVGSRPTENSPTEMSEKCIQVDRRSFASAERS